MPFSDYLMHLLDTGESTKAESEGRCSVSLILSIFIGFTKATSTQVRNLEISKHIAVIGCLNGKSRFFKHAKSRAQSTCIRRTRRILGPWGPPMPTSRRSHKVYGERKLTSESMLFFANVRSVYTFLASSKPSFCFFIMRLTSRLPASFSPLRESPSAMFSPRLKSREWKPSSTSPMNDDGTRAYQTLEKRSSQ